MILKFDTIENIRDLGGYITKDNKRIKANLLLRSATLANCSPADFNILYNEYKVRTIVDFRSSRSFEKLKDKIDYDKIDYHHEIVLEYLEKYPYLMSDNPRPFKFFIDVYHHMAIENQAIIAYKNFFDHLLNCNDGAFLYHCTSGKDRTGIATVLLLHILGCDKKTIYHEHLLTNVGSAPKFDSFLSTHPNLNELEYEYYDCYYLAKKEFLDEFYNTIDKLYGSLDNYVFNGLKLTKEDISILKKRFLEENT